MTADQKPVAPLFHASAVKIKRARKHWAELKAMTDEYIASKPVVHEVDQRKGAIGFKSHFRTPPEEFGGIFGDLMHNLRSALDLLACDLARKNGRSVKGVYFPFCEAKKDLKEMIKRRNFARAGEDAVALLASYAPYHGGNDALRAIHDLDIQDKHLELIPTSTQWVSPVIEIERDDTGAIKSVSLVEDSIDKTEVRIVFPNGTVLEGKEIIPALHDLIELTASVVEAFKALSEIPGVAVDAASGHGLAADLPSPAEGGMRSDEDKTPPIDPVVQSASS